MPFSVFGHDRPSPSPEELAQALGETTRLWSGGIVRLAEEFGPCETAWYSYGRVSGWSLNVKDRAGTLAYFYPQRGGFIVVVNVGHAAAARSRAQGAMAAEIDAAIAGGRPYPKGHTVSTDVCTERDLDTVVALCQVLRAG